MVQPHGEAQGPEGQPGHPEPDPSPEPPAPQPIPPPEPVPVPEPPAVGRHEVADEGSAEGVRTAPDADVPPISAEDEPVPVRPTADDPASPAAAPSSPPPDLTAPASPAQPTSPPYAGQPTSPSQPTSPPYAGQPTSPAQPTSPPYAGQPPYPGQPGSPPPYPGQPASPVGGPGTYPGGPAGTWPVTSARPRRRGLLWASLAVVVALLLCGGGGVSAFLLLRNAENGEGAPDPATAVNRFMTAVYTQHDVDAAAGLVCRETRDEKKIAAKIDEVKAYATTYKGPRFRWADPAVANQNAERALVSVDLTMTTDDEKTAEQQLTFTVVKKSGWWVCEVSG